MTDSGEVYPSKKDWWIVLLVVFGAVMMLAAGYDLLLQDLDAWLKYGAGGFSILAALFCFWLLVGTRYVLTREQLRIRCGPIRMNVKVADITEVYPTKNPLSSPALSLDRLMIVFGEGLTKRVMISPRDKEAFMRRMRLLQPELRPTQKGGLKRRELAENELLDVE